MFHKLNLSRDLSCPTRTDAFPENPGAQGIPAHTLKTSQEDDAGQSRVYAAEQGGDKVELAPALIEFGVYGDLSEALKSAALRGDVETTQCLISAKADTPKTLAELAARDDGHLSPMAAAKAAKLLISLGVNISSALDYAAKNFCAEAVSTLLLLGANGSDMLVSAAISRDTNTLRQLISAGADVVTALVTLARDPDKKAHEQAARLLILENNRQHLHDCPAGLRSQTTVMSRLAKDRDTTAMLRLRRAMVSENPGWDELAKSGDIESIKLLIPPSDMQYPIQHLRQLSLEGHFVGVKTLIAAAVPTKAVINELLVQYSNWWDPLTSGAIKLLIAAGADPSEVPDEINTAFNKRKTEISNLSEIEKTATLLSAIKKDDVAEIVMLTDAGSHVTAALQHLSQAKDLNDIEKTLGLCRLINAGAISSQTLLDQVQAGDMDVAKTLAQLEDIANDALIVSITSGDQQTPRTLIPTLTDGRFALIQATESSNQDLTKTLLAIGADGPGALMSLLHTKSREAAGRLIALGVDIQATLIRATREDPNVYQNVIEDLTSIGAEFPADEEILTLEGE